MRGLLALLAIAAILAVQYAEARALSEKRVSRTRMIRGRKWHGLVPKPDRPADLSSRVADQHFVQQLDHFDASNNKTWLQRFWYNDKWYKPGGPQFLMIGGESAESPTWVERDDFEWTSLAKEVGAAVFLLEHRFYGESQPTGDLKFESLKYLSSEQALADLNTFILAQNKVLNLTSPRWITFGGSYSGALSAWARQKYPDTVYAAVGSSGPVQAVVDFTGYLDVVYNALHSYNPKCAESAHNGFLKVNELGKTSDGLKTLTSTFSICTDLNKADNNTLYTFYESIIGNYMGIVQYSEDNVSVYASELTIPQLCKKQLGANSDLGGVAAVNEWLMDQNWESCLDVNYQESIDALKNTDAGSEWGDYRSWIWQTCNEFGYYQSTDSDLVVNKFTGADIPIDFYVQQCAQIYDASYENATVYTNVDKTNQYYYGQTGYNGTRVSLPNGTNDPWHVLGVLKATNGQVYPSIIAGTSHCADMYPAGPNDKPGLTAARKAIRTHVLSWSTA
uniref:Serine protease K12H4.7 n=1 Tax=Panagrellus redivivus TaxID=6233 RepID=A0A7E4US96_PANRE